MSDSAAVEAVLFAALEKPTGGERTAFLDSACGGDAELRRQVERLLKAHAHVGDFLQKPVVEQLAPAPESTDATQEIAATEGPGAGPAAGTGLYLARTEGAGSREENSALDFLQPSTRPGSLGQLGHYEILQLLGQGGFGIVFRAFDEQLQRVVAIKVLAPDMAANATARKRFLREARVSARVRHENVVQVYAVEEEPLPYLVMEFVPGETLQQRLERVGPLDVTEVVQFGRQIAEGLAAAHKQGLIHRDIKPGNILIEAGPNHQARITDFGLARAADDASLTQSGVVAGTPQFMAPEQAGAGTLDHRADLFSLGSVLYTICTGRPPFRAPSTLAVLKRVVEETPRPIREIIPEVPEWLCDLISRLHAKKPEDRIGTAREVADLLGQGLAALQSPGSVEPPSFGPTEVRKAASSQPMTEVVPPIQPRARSRRWVAAAAVLLALLGALGFTEATGVTQVRGTVLRLFSSEGKQVVRVGQETRPSDAKAAREGSPPEFTNTLGMKFKLIPAGKFRMGSAREEIDRFRGKLANEDGYVTMRLAAEVPEHPVEITQPFYLGTTEVTLGHFRRFVEESGYNKGDAPWKQVALKQTDDHPVDRVSWQNAIDFCNWLSKKEGKKYRLPTEAEWEYCCRAGKSGTRYCFGDDEDVLQHYAWYKKNSGIVTHPVGQKKPNEWGLYDMHGNVWEWCQDWYQADYYQNSPLQDPPGGVGGMRVIRGGSLGDGPVACRSAFRYEHPADVGFRVLLVIHPAGDRTESGAKEKGDGAQTMNPDRRAAEYVLSLGGMVDVNVNGQSQRIQAATPLPREPFRLTGGYLHNIKQVSDEGLANFKGCTNLTHLFLENTRVSDVGLAHFKDCKDLTFLVLSGTQVTDAGLAYFKDRNLRNLYLSDTKVTDAGLAIFKDCKDLGELILQNMQLTDAGLAHFKNAKSVYRVHIDGTQITDAGLAQFKECKNLGDLWVSRTKVSAAGIDELKKALPRCRISWDAGPTPARPPGAEKGLGPSWVGLHWPDQLPLGAVHVGATVEASFLVYEKEDPKKLSLTIDAPPFVKVLARSVIDRDVYDGNDWVKGAGGIVVLGIDTGKAGTFEGEVKVKLGTVTARVPVSVVVKPSEPAAVKILVVESPFVALSTEKASVFKDWTDLVAEAGWDVSYLILAPGKPLFRDLDLSKFGVVLLAGGGLTDNADDVKRIRSFVEGGGRLVVAANHPFSGSVAAANKVIKGYGLQMLDSEQSEALLDRKALAPEIRKAGISSARFVRASPVVVTDVSRARVLVKAARVGGPEDGFVAVARAGKGEVVVLGESLWWYWLSADQAEGTDNAKLLRLLLTPAR